MEIRETRGVVPVIDPDDMNVHRGPYYADNDHTIRDVRGSYICVCWEKVIADSFIVILNGPYNGHDEEHIPIELPSQ